MFILPLCKVSGKPFILNYERNIFMAFDGIVTKIIASEIQNLKGAKVDKVYQPNKNTIILGIYLDGSKYLLNLCIDSNLYRINLSTYDFENPLVAPNFCMLLRKHLIGLKLKSIITSNLERLVIIDFEGFNDIDDLISKRLIVELMGKHSNVILLDDENIIIDSLRHISSDIDNATTRNIFPHHKYVLPNISKKLFNKLSSFEEFKICLPKNITLDNLASAISETFNGISKLFVQHTLENFHFTCLNDTNLKILYNFLFSIIYEENLYKLSFDKIYDENGSLKDYYLRYNNDKVSENLKSDDIDKNNQKQLFPLNYFIDDFYYEKETRLIFTNYRNSIYRLVLDSLNKYHKRLENMDAKLLECQKLDKYKLWGELITANLYKIKTSNLTNISDITLENYYDNNNFITIPLDKKFSPAINAKRYFKKYNKLKNTLQFVSKQKKETIQDINYIESIIYELENASSLNHLADIYEEVSESNIFKDKYKMSASSSTKKSKLKQSKLTKNRNISFNPIKYAFDGFTILVGRNNKENDYLTLKYANKNDIWFHVKDVHGSHVILKVNDNKITSIPENVLIKCAEIAAFHSKAKFSSKVQVDYCEVKFVKKPSSSKPGMVIYTNNKSFLVEPKGFNDIKCSS